MMQMDDYSKALTYYQASIKNLSDNMNELTEEEADSNMDYINID